MALLSFWQRPAYQVGGSFFAIQALVSVHAGVSVSKHDGPFSHPFAYLATNCYHKSHRATAHKFGLVCHAAIDPQTLNPET